MLNDKPRRRPQKVRHEVKPYDGDPAWSAGIEGVWRYLRNKWATEPVRTSGRAIVVRDLSGNGNDLVEGVVFRPEPGGGR